MIPRAWLIATAIASSACARSEPATDGRPPNATRPLDSARASRRDSLFGAGKAVYAAGAFDSAHALWLNALALARAERDSALEARLLTELALASRKLGRLDEARAVAESALALKEQLRLRTEVSRSLNVLGLIALSDNRNTDASRLFERAIESAAAVNDAEGVAKATGNAALAYGYLGDLRRARAGHRLLRRVGRNLANAYFEANGLANEALVDIAEGDASSAIARLDTARALYRRAPTEAIAGEQNALLHLATALELRGDYPGAFATLDTSLALTRTHKLKEQEIFLLRMLGGLHRRIGDHPRALRYYAQAESLARASSVKSDLATVLRGSAESFALAGNVPRAVNSAEEAYRLHTASGEILEQVEDLILLAGLDARLGRTSSVSNRLRRADTLARSSGVRLAMAQTGLALATEADRRGDARRTLRALSRIDPATLNFDFEIAWTASALSARAYSRLGALDSAVAQGRRAVAAIERLRTDLSLEPMRTSLLAERADVYGDHIITLLRLGRTEEAFQVSDRARSRVLLERLSAIGGGHSDALVPRELVESEELLRRIAALVAAFRASPSPPRRRGAEPVEGGSEIEAQLTAARSDYEALMIRAAQRHPRTAALLGAGTMSVSAVQAALEPGELLAEYFVAADRILIFTASRDRVQVLERAVTHESLAERIRLLREISSAPHAEWGADAGIPVSRSLYADLVAPIEGANLLRDVRRLVIVPHGLIGQLPFAALQSDAGGRYLVERFAVMYAPSAAAFSAARRSRAAPSRAVGFGFAPFDRDLPASRLEVRAVAALLPGLRSASGSSATEAVVRLALSEPGVVHIATHGLMNPYNPLFSSVDLAPAPRTNSGDNNDGRLEVRELLGMQIRSTLVFLSGCETGASESWVDTPVRGSGELALSQAFLSAGAQNVISTLWRIDDSGGAAFAAHFYENLRHMPASDAVALAQRQMISDVRTRHPYYWAAYVLAGEGQYTLAAQSPVHASVY